MKSHSTPAMSRNAAINNLAHFFALSPDSDIVTLEQIFRAHHRDLANEKRNKSWLFNKLTMMKDYELVVRQYSSDTGLRELTGLKLTETGKRALGRDTNQSEQVHSEPLSSAPKSIIAQQNSEVTLESVYSAIRALRRQMPSFDIVFEIKPREENVFTAITNGVNRLVK